MFFQGARERRLGILADKLRNLRQRRARATKPFGRNLHAPIGKIVHWRHAEEANEMIGQRRARQANLAAKLVDGPAPRDCRGVAAPVPGPRGARASQRTSRFGRPAGLPRTAALSRRITTPKAWPARSPIPDGRWRPPPPHIETSPNFYNVSRPVEAGAPLCRHPQRRGSFNMCRDATELSFLVLQLGRRGGLCHALRSGCRRAAGGTPEYSGRPGVVLHEHKDRTSAHVEGSDQQTCNNGASDLVSRWPQGTLGNIKAAAEKRPL